jgi:hypothetical protein
MGIIKNNVGLDQRKIRTNFIIVIIPASGRVQTKKSANFQQLIARF